jgi:hypothetical protein
VQVTNNAEGGTNQTTVTTANSGGTSGTAFNVVNSTSSTVVFDSTQKAGGTYSIRTAVGATSSVANFGWTTALGTPTRVYGRVYFRLPSIVVNREIIRWRRSTTQIARLRVDLDTGVLELRQGNNAAPATSGGTGTVPLSANTWYRVEWDIQAGTLTNTIRLFLGDSATPLETITGNGVFATTGTITEVMFGQFTSVSNVGDMFFDDIVVNDTGYPGPARNLQQLTRGTNETLTSADSAKAIGTESRGTAETLVAADAAKAIGTESRGAGETLVLGDSAVARRALGRAVAESSTLAESWLRQIARLSAIAESLGLGDVVQRGATAYARPVAEPVALADAAAAKSTRARGTAEPVSAVDSTGTILVRGRGTAESVQALDVPTRQVVRARPVAEPVQLADTGARQISRAAAAAEALALVDALGRSRVVLVGSPNTMTSSDAWGYTSGRAVGSGNTIGVADGAGRALVLGRATGEALTLGHAVATGRGVMLAVAEALTVADTFARAAGRARGWSEFTALDNLVAVRTAYGVGVAEPVDVDDQFKAGRVVLAGIAETLVLVEAVARQLAGGADTDEALALGHGFARTVGRGRGVAEALPLGHALTSGQWVMAGVAEAIALGHTFTRHATTFVRFAPQTLTLADVIVRGPLSMGRAVAQPLGLGDVWRSGRVLLVGVAELVDLDDAAGRTKAAGRGTAEAIALGHSIVRVAIARARAAGDVFAMNDTAQTGRILTPSASEQMQIGDGWSRSSSTARGVLEPMVFAHLVSRGVARGRAASAAVQLVDGWLAQREIIPVAVAGEIAFNDTAVARAGRGRAAASALGMAAGSARRIDRARLVPEALGLYELARAVRGQSAATDVQPMTLDDIARASTARSLAVAETVLLFAAAGAGDSSGNPIVIAHAAWVRMSRPPVGRVRMTRSPGGGVRMTEGG